jgi:2-polyprenyl-3-methyl-5-hydroxy-6-metoxy-1,4-benzoquinol methylase
MMDFNERVIPGVSSNFMYKEALSRYEFAVEKIKRDSIVLDLGCGTGYGTQYLAKYVKKITGIDVDREAIKFARKNYPHKNLEYKVADISSLNGTGKYDVIVSFEVIEHLKNPKSFISKAHKMLKKGGTLIISTPNAEVVSPKGGVASPYHEKEFDYMELKSMLREKFTNVEIFGQNKSKKAKESWKDFLKSQEKREELVKSDLFSLRKIIPKNVKEFLWKYVGNIFGRKTQENVETSDFPISKKSVRLSFYFIAICQKSR